MKKIFKTILASASALFLIAGIVGVVSASTISSPTTIKLASTTKPVKSVGKSKNIGQSGIPRSVFRNDRLNAMASVLNTSVSNVQSAMKSKTLKTLISSNHLTPAEFRKNVKGDMKTSLTSQGYSTDQIIIASKQIQINHLHREIKKLKS